MNTHPTRAVLPGFALVLCLAATSLPGKAGGDDTPDRPALKDTPRAVPLVDQGGADPRLKGYAAPEGVKVEIVAEAPVVVNPIDLAFGDDGTPFVIEWRAGPDETGREVPQTFTYKDGSKRTLPTVRKASKDVVKALIDEKGKGVYDRAKVVLEDELPSGLLLHDGWLYLCGNGTVRRYRPKEPGGEYSVREVIAHGFGATGWRQVSGLTLGDDGWLYVACGGGDHFVEGSDGSRATVLRSGAVFRCRTDGSRLETFATGLCNPYRGGAFDSLGNLFLADNGGGHGWNDCRLLHAVAGGDYGWRLAQGERLAPDPFRTAGEALGGLPSLRETGDSSVSGIFIYDDTRFPERYRGLIYRPVNAGRSVRAYRAEPRGASFAVTEEFDFLKSDDPLFRPCQVTAGPDGALYVVDWRSETAGTGRLGGDGTHGRILRLSWAGTREQTALPPRPTDTWRKVVRSSDDELLKTLSGEDASLRRRAARELVRRGDRNGDALLRVLAGDESPLTARVAALGVLEAFWNAGVQKAVLRQLDEGESPLRRLAADALGRHAARGDAAVHDRLLRVLNDNDLALRRAAALAMARLAAPGAADALVNTLTFDDSGDAFLRDGLVRAVEALGKPGIDRLLVQAESGVRKDTDLVVTVFARLRTRPGYEGLPSLLKYPHLTVAQRVALVRSCGNYLLEPPIDLDPIIGYLSGPGGKSAEVKRAGAGLLAAGGTRPGGRAAKWLLGLLEDEDGGVRLEAIRAAGALRLAEARPRLEKMKADEGRPGREREAAAAAVRAIYKAPGR